MLILFLILIVLALVILIANIAIVPQAYSYVVERLGVYYTTWEAGFHFKTPFVTRIAKKVSLKEQVVDFKPQPVIQDAMEKQMKAERQRRESILRAEGEKKSAILVAEGEKESAILRADAVREQRIREAEGEAQALMTVQKALADSIRLLNDAAPTDKVLAIKSLEALQKVADGKATKLIIPSEIQNLTGLLAAAKETVTDAK